MCSDVCAETLPQLLYHNRMLSYCITRLLTLIKTYNRLLEDVKEMWTEYSRGGKGKQRGSAMNKDRYVQKMFLRGDSVILVVSNPASLAA